MSCEVLVAGNEISAHNFAAQYTERVPDSRVHIIGKPYKSPRSWLVFGSQFPPDALDAIKRGDIGSNDLTAVRFVLFDGSRVGSDFKTSYENILPPFTSFMVDDKDLTDYYRRKTANNPKVVVTEDTVTGAHSTSQGLVVETKDGLTSEAAFGVDASGSQSTLLREHKPALIDDDPVVLWIHGYRVEGEFDPKTMVFPLKDKSTGRVSWIAPWSDTIADVLASDYCRLSEYPKKKQEFENTYRNLKKLCVDNRLCKIGEEIEHVKGKIRLVPQINSPSNKSIYAVGSAAGQSCPNMAESVTTTIRQSTELAKALELDPELTPSKYHKHWRSGDQAQYLYELQLAFLVSRLVRQKAGGNGPLYRAIVDQATPEAQLRMVTDRKFTIKDAPVVLKAATSNLEFAVGLAKLFGRTALFKWNPNAYRNLLYGK